jgi:hypothetical protein
MTGSSTRGIMTVLHPVSDLATAKAVYVRSLRTHGIFRSRRVGKMVMYSLTEEGRKLLASVLPAPATRRRKHMRA